MIFTWDYNNLCIIFRSWRVDSTFTLLWSLAAVAALTAGYEAVREASRRYEARQTEILENMPSKCNLHTRQDWSAVTHDPPEDDQLAERSSLLRVGHSVAAQEKKFKVVNAASYGVQVFYSFFIM